MPALDRVGNADIDASAPLYGPTLRASATQDQGSRAALVAGTIWTTL
jgi:hypothetical protein